jgi:Rhs element Vgr protein
MVSALGIAQSSDVTSLVIEIDGQELPGSVPILGVEVLYELNRIPFARLRVADGDPSRGDFAQSSGAFFVPGAQVVIRGGYHGQVEEVFSGVVLCQRLVVRRDRSWLEVECRDKAFRMTLAPSARYFEEMTDSDVAESLLAEHGLTAELTATNVTHPQLFQFNVSDWDFLVSRLEANGQLCAIRAGSVRSFVPALDAEPELEVTFGSTLLELEAELDARSQKGSVTALAWDAAAQDLVSTSAVDPRWEGNGNLSATDLQAASSFDEEFLRHGGALGSDALQAWADARLLRSRLAASIGRARFQGSASVQLGQVVQLAGVSERFNGKIFISAFRHEFVDNDWFVDVQFGLPDKTHLERFPPTPTAGGYLPAVQGLQIGIVTQLADDPASEHRVRVKVPLAGMGEQGVWARVATLDAGSSRGTFFRPEPADEVVLGFLHGDPTQAVILGMLHSSAKAPPLEATEDNHEKGYVSRSGIKLLFDDDKKVLTIQTPGGNSLRLDDDEGGIFLEDQNGNSLTLSSDGIAWKSAADLAVSASGDVTVEGGNIGLKGQQTFKAEGASSTEVTSSATVKIQGTMVQIN